MARSDRLFDIIQILRLSRRPVTATAMAAELEVTPRTVYRDIAILQARRVPIEGAVGLGYMLRPGFDLPALMFSEDEVEAIAVALRLLHRTGDPGLMNAAVGVAGKLASAMPEALRNQFAGSSFRVSPRGAPPPAIADLAPVRRAIRQSRWSIMSRPRWSAHGASCARTTGISAPTGSRARACWRPALPARPRHCGRVGWR